MQRKLRLTLLIAALVAMLAAGAVWAGDRAADGTCSGSGRARRPVMGVITAIDGDKLTVRPEVPQWLASKLAARGASLPELPASVSFWIGTDTVAYQNSTETSVGNFKVGDRIAATLDGDAQSGTAHARRLADDTTAQAFAGKLKARRDERIARSGRPVMGTIIAIDGNTVTLKPELPQFMLDKLAERGRQAPPLPDSVSFTVGADAQLTRTTGPAQLSDFKVGEQVGAQVKGDLRNGPGSAVKLADIETAKAAVQQKLGGWKAKRSSSELPPTFAPMGSVTDSGPRNTASAREGQGEGRGKGKGGQRGAGRGRDGDHHPPLLGKITKIEGNQITVKPFIPEWARQRAEEKGRELPSLPDSISFTVDASTDYVLDGEPGSKSDFKVGDEIAVMLEGKPQDGNAVARKVADIESARQRMERGGPEGGRGEGGRGEGGGGERGPRPMFGTITSVDRHSITIKPELPDFVKAMHEGRGGPGDEGGPRGAGGPEGGRGGKGKGQGRGGDGPRELPAQLTIDLVGTTKYFQNDSEVAANPFKAGDKVAIMPAEGSEGREITARAVTDYATAEARTKQRAKEGGKGQGGKRGRGKGNKTTEGQSA